MGTQSLDRLVLEAVEERGSIETFEFAKECGKDHQSIVGSIKSIHALGDVSLKFFRNKLHADYRRTFSLFGDFS